MISFEVLCWSHFPLVNSKEQCGRLSYLKIMRFKKGFFVYIGVLLGLVLSSRAETAGHPVRLAVAGFSLLGDNAESRTADALLCELLTARLSQGTQFELVERKKIDLAANEISISLAHISKPADAIKVGQLLNADWLLCGSMVKLQGSNAIVAKILDAQTGIIRDLTCLPLGSNVLNYVEPIQKFLTASVENKSALSNRVFIGIGGFEDMSINDRYREFRKEFRTLLERNYQGTRFSIVERSMINPLLKELRLNLAGLTEKSATTVLPQPAFFLVDGVYQSFQDGQSKISLLLRIQKVGATQERFDFKETPGSTLDQRLLETVTKVVSAPVDTARADHRQEARLQLDRGTERARFGFTSDEVNPSLGTFFEGRIAGYFPFEGEMERQKRRQNLSEAMESFQTALLLDPDNMEARILLGACLLDVQVDNKTEAREYIGEVLAGTTNRPMIMIARRLLAHSYLKEDDRRAFDLFRKAYRDYLKPGMYRNDLRLGFQEAMRNLTESGKMSRPEQLKFQRQMLLEACDDAEKNLDEKISVDVKALLGEHQYFAYLVQDREQSRKYLEDLLPELRKNHPRLISYFEEYYGKFSRGEDQPQFTKSAPEPVKPVSRECRPVDEIFHFGHAFAFADDGPQVWIGDGSILFRYDKASRQMTEVEWPLNLAHRIISIVPTTESLWLATLGDGLIEVSRDLKHFKTYTETNGLLLPYLKTLYLNGNKLWIGFQFGEKGGVGYLDLTTRAFTGLTPNLSVRPETPIMYYDSSLRRMMPVPTTTATNAPRSTNTAIALGMVSKSTILVGLPSGSQQPGGIPLPDLVTHNAESYTEPPRKAVVGIALVSSNEVWLAVKGKGLQKGWLAENRWKTQNVWSLKPAIDMYSLNCLVSDSKHVVLGSQSAIGVYSLASGQWTGTPLTEVECVALDGDSLWVGGEGFWAKFNLQSNTVEQRCEIAGAIHSIQVNASEVWMASEEALYRLGNAK
ncbi:MAG: hypothetical protein JWM68_2902 [Verrucomicrobiales bacterium]|nr:hypothetical protein [Verrucomicrobiales bacterium]